MQIGTMVYFDPANLNEEYWNSLTEEERCKYYGHLGYGEERVKTFVFICELVQQPGHCMVASMDGKIELCHMSDLSVSSE